MSASSVAQIVPPPWTLTGRGFVLLYRFPPDWVRRHGNLPPLLPSRFIGGFGAVMLVDYASSDCGPYRELLFVPGQFRLPDGAAHYAITRILVSTPVSVDSGIANWAIPKTLGAFDWTSSGDAVRVRVLQGDAPVAEFHFSSAGPSLPVSTGVVPAAWRTLAQPDASGDTLLTAPSGSGTLRLARLERAVVNGALFPDVTEFKPLLALRAEPFRLGFPVPQRKRLAWV